MKKRNKSNYTKISIVKAPKTVTAVAIANGMKRKKK